jgi:CO dehydrogenase maturation factor
MMKLALSGKGGCGKTTITALFSKILAADGRKVLVVDADPDANLALTLGFPNTDKITPITEMKQLIHERTETTETSAGMFFKMNPRVDDIPESLSTVHDGIKLIHMGTVYKGGGGCACPENVFVRALLSHLMLERDEVVLVDLPAGIEHLGRGTAMGVDMLIVVTDPTAQSVQTLTRVRQLAADLKIRNIAALGNKIRTDDERQFILNNSPLDVIGFLHFDQNLIQGKIADATPALLDEIRGVVYKIEGILEGEKPNN